MMTINLLLINLTSYCDLIYSDFNLSDNDLLDIINMIDSNIKIIQDDYFKIISNLPKGDKI